MKYTVIMTFLLISLFTLIYRVSIADSKHDDDRNEYRFWQKKPGVKPVSNVLYQEECGSCHFAYQPGLLPSRSWNKIMANLENHYGDNAELDNADMQLISRYLVDNSAEKSRFRRSVKIMRSISSTQTPTRITKIPYFVHEHDEIPSRLVINNPNVASLSQCDTCHRTAEKGSFSERDISIPGYGKWDD